MMYDNIQVAIRVRQLIDKEKQAGLKSNWVIDGERIYCGEDSSNGKRPTVYTFDHIFDETSVTLDVFNHTCKKIVDASLNGFNGTIFAYGQSSSGKTHTITGSQLHPGIIPLAVDEIFNQIANIPDREYLIRVSYMEIYNEKLTDLLKDDDTNLKIQEDTKEKAIRIVGIHEEMVHNHSVVPEILKKGNNKRHTAATKQNDRSSRSHCILRFVIESRIRGEEDEAVKVSHLYFVDLAGSEKAADNSGDRFREGCSINKSLFTLSNVIRKLSGDDNFQHASYRDSKLTRILQNALGGNSKTAIICTITPAHIEESESTLKFASRAKTIKNEAHINEVVSDTALLKRYLNKIKNLEKQVKEVNDEHLVKKLEENEAYLKEQEETIKNLKKMILISGPVKTDDPPAKKRRRETWAPGKLGKPRLSLQGASSFSKTSFNLEDPIIEEEEQPTEMLFINEEAEEDVKFELEQDFQNQTIGSNPTVKELFELQDKHELLLMEIEKKDKEHQDLKMFKELERQMQEQTIKELSDKVKDWEGSQQWLEEELMKAQQERNSLRQKVESLTRQLKSAEAGVGLTEKCEQIATAEKKNQELESDMDIQKSRYEFHIERLKRKVESYAKMLDEAGVDSDFMKQRLSAETDFDDEIADVKTVHDVKVTELQDQIADIKTVHDVKVNELQDEIDLLVLSLEREKKKVEELNEQYIKAFEDQKRRFQKDIEERDEEIEIYRGMLEEATSHNEGKESQRNMFDVIADKDIKHTLSDYQSRVKLLESELEKYKRNRDEVKPEVLLGDEVSSSVREQQDVHVHAELTKSEIENLKQMYEKEVDIWKGKYEALSEECQEKSKESIEHTSFHRETMEAELESLKTLYEGEIEALKLENRKLSEKLQQQACVMEWQSDENIDKNDCNDKVKNSPSAMNVDHFLKQEAEQVNCVKTDICSQETEITVEQLQELRQEYEDKMLKQKLMYEDLLRQHKNDVVEETKPLGSLTGVMKLETEMTKKTNIGDGHSVIGENEEDNFSNQTAENFKIQMEEMRKEFEMKLVNQKEMYENLLGQSALCEGTKDQGKHLELETKTVREKTGEEKEIEEEKNLTLKQGFEYIQTGDGEAEIRTDIEEKQIQKVRDEYEKKMKTMQEAYDDLLKQTDYKYSEASNFSIMERDKLTAEMEEMRCYYEEKIKEMTNETSMEEKAGRDDCMNDLQSELLKAEMEEMKEKYENEIKELKSSFEQVVSDNRTEFESHFSFSENSEIKLMKEEIVNLKQSYEQKLQELSEQLDNNSTVKVRDLTENSYENYKRQGTQEKAQDIEVSKISDFESEFNEGNNRGDNERNLLSIQTTEGGSETMDCYPFIQTDKVPVEMNVEDIRLNEQSDTQTANSALISELVIGEHNNNRYDRMEAEIQDLKALNASLDEEVKNLKEKVKHNEIDDIHKVDKTSVEIQTEAVAENERNDLEELPGNEMNSSCYKDRESFDESCRMYESTIKEIGDELASFKGRLKKLQDEIEQLQDANKSLKNDKTELVNEKAELKKNLEVYSETVEMLKESLKESEKDVKLLRAVEVENTELFQRIEQMEGDSKLSSELILEYEAQVKELKEKLNSEKENDQNLVSEDEVRRMEENFSEKLESIKSEKERLEDRLHILEEEKCVQALRDQHEKIVMESTVNRNEAEERLRSLENEKLELLTKLQEQEGESAERQQNLKVFSETVEKLMESLKESEKEVELLRAVEVENTELLERIEQMEGDSKLSSELILEYEAQVKELKEKLNSEKENDQNLVSEDEVRRMEENFSEKLESIKSEKERLEDRLHILEEEKCVEIQALRDQHEKIVMESTVNRNEAKERLRSLENEKLELLTKLQEQEGESAERQQNLKVFSETVEKLMESLKESEKEVELLRAVEVENTELLERIEQMEGDSKLSSELILEYEAQVKELKEKLNSEKENDQNLVSEDEVKRMEENFSEKLESIKSEKERLEDRLHILEEEKCVEIQALRDQHEKIVMESTVNRNEAEERLRSLENEKLELLTKLQEQEGESAERQQTVDLYAEIIEDLKVSIKELEKDNSDLSTNCEKIQRDQSVEKEQYASEIGFLQDRLEKLECEHKLNLELIEEYEIEVSKLKEKLLNEKVSTVRKEKMEELEKFYSEKLLTIKKEKDDVELSLKGQISMCELEIQELKSELSSCPSELNCVSQTDMDRLEQLEKDNEELKEQIQTLEREKEKAKSMIESLEADKDILERNLPPDTIKYHSLPENLDWENKWEDFVREEKKKRYDMGLEIRRLRRQISEFDESTKRSFEDSVKIIHLTNEVESLEDKLAALEAEKKNSIKNTGYIADEDHSCKFRQDNLRIKAEMDEVREELEAKKQSFEEVAQNYEQRIRKLKDEIRRLNDMDQTYVGGFKQPSFTEDKSITDRTPQENVSKKLDTFGSSTSGGIVDHFKVCLVEAENKRLKKELEKVKKDLARLGTIKKENTDSVSSVKQVDKVKAGDKSRIEDTFTMPTSGSKQRHALEDLTRKAPTPKASDLLDVSDKEGCKLDLTSLYKKQDERLQIHKKQRDREPENCKTN